MECMQAHAKRIEIARNHKNICQGSETEEYQNWKTPEYTGEELQEAYSEDKRIRKILKENFKKELSSIQKKKWI